MSALTSGSTSGPVTGLVLQDRDGARVLTITMPGVVALLLTVTPVVVAVGVLHRVAPDAPWWPSAVVVLLAVVSAELPDSGAGLVTLGVLVAWWLVAVTEPETWWALLVSWCCLVFHVALAHAAAGPSGCTPARAVVGRLVRRCVVVLLVPAGLAVVAGAAEGWGEPPALVVGVTLALVGALPWLAAHRGDG